MYLSFHQCHKSCFQLQIFQITLFYKMWNKVTNHDWWQKNKQALLANTCCGFSSPYKWLTTPANFSTPVSSSICSHKSISDRKSFRNTIYPAVLLRPILTRHHLFPPVSAHRNEIIPNSAVEENERSRQGWLAEKTNKIPGTRREKTPQKNSKVIMTNP